MRLRQLAAAAALATGLAFLSGCAIDPGAPVTEDREIDDVRAVELATAGDLVVTRGDTAALSVTAGEKVIDSLTSETDEGVLRLGDEGGPLPLGGDIRFELTVPTLDAITVSGSGDAEVDFAGASAVRIEISGSGSVAGSGIDADKVSVAIDGSGEIDLTDMETEDLTVSVDGSGDIQVQGRATRQDVEIRGAGGYAAAGLESTDARVLISGSGDVDVTVTGSLAARIEGSGAIRYAGDPDVESEVSGSGEVVAR